MAEATTLILTGGFTPLLPPILTDSGATFTHQPLRAVQPYGFRVFKTTANNPSRHPLAYPQRLRIGPCKQREGKVKNVKVLNYH